nr:MAG TPA: hypothetical protein [Caudoviricetes sp.]
MFIQLCKLHKLYLRQLNRGGVQFAYTRYTISAHLR